jgi:hypothetical protein
MLASVLGMALSIEFGIAKTYTLGLGFYVMCGLMIVISRRANRISVFTARPVKDPGLLHQGEVASVAVAGAPSIQPTQAELTADIKTATSPGSSVLARAGEVGE